MAEGATVGNGGRVGTSSYRTPSREAPADASTDASRRTIPTRIASDKDANVRARILDILFPHEALRFGTHFLLQLTGSLECCTLTATARIARVMAPGHPHHVAQRGNRRQHTFFSDEDHRVYLELMGEWCGRCGARWGRIA